MPEDASFCPGCGRGMNMVEPAHGTAGVLPVTLAGALAYFLVPAILFLFVDPYSRNRFLRFHSFQSIGFWFAGVVVAAILRIIAIVLAFIPVVDTLIVGLFTIVTALAFCLIWIVLLVKALQGEMFELPLVGDFAALQANRGMLP